MKPSESLTKAFVLGRIMEFEILDKAGHCYFGHIERVVNSIKSRHGENQTLIKLAYLHDMVEDELTTYQELIDRGYSDEVIKSLKLLTRIKDMTYDEYIQNIINNADINALKVKRADLEDNMNLSRLEIITEQDVKRLEKRYIPSWYKINRAILKLESQG